MNFPEKKIKGGLIIGLVEEPKPAEAPKAEPEKEAPKKRSKKTTE
jgi:hypothetical protein